MIKLDSDSEGLPKIFSNEMCKAIVSFSRDRKYMCLAVGDHKVSLDGSASDPFFPPIPRSSNLWYGKE